MKIVNLIAYILTIIGGINWFSIGVFQLDLVSAIFGSQVAIGSRIIYILVGVAALYLIYAAIAERGNVDLNPASNEYRD